MAASLAPLPDPSPATLSLRSVHRAAAELRRGVPVLLDGPAPLLLLAAETAGADGLRDLAALGVGAPLLLLAPARAAALLGRPTPEPGPIALHTAGLTEPATLRAAADPTIAQVLPVPPRLAPSPEGSGAAVALAKIARLLPAVLVVPLRPGASAAGRGLLAVDPGAVLAHPHATAAGLERVADAAVPLLAARDARVVAFRTPDAGVEHLAILVGQPEAHPAPLVRLHSECFTGDLLGSLRCDCGPQLHAALARMGEAGTGALLYLSQEGRGIGIAGKLRAYALQDTGLDTVDANRALGWQADERNYALAAAMLARLGIGTVRLLTNNPAKVAALEACGVVVQSREPLVIAPNGVNDRYLATKAARMGHTL